MQGKKVTDELRTSLLQLLGVCVGRLRYIHGKTWTNYLSVDQVTAVLQLALDYFQQSLQIASCIAIAESCRYGEVGCALVDSLIDKIINTVKSSQDPKTILVGIKALSHVSYLNNVLIC